MPGLWSVRHWDLFFVSFVWIFVFFIGSLEFKYFILNDNSLAGEGAMVNFFLHLIKPWLYHVNFTVQMERPSVKWKKLPAETRLVWTHVCSNQTGGWSFHFLEGRINYIKLYGSWRSKNPLTITPSQQFLTVWTEKYLMDTILPSFFLIFESWALTLTEWNKSSSALTVVLTLVC